MEKPKVKEPADASALEPQSASEPPAALDSPRKKRPGSKKDRFVYAETQTPETERKRSISSSVERRKSLDLCQRSSFTSSGADDSESSRKSSMSSGRKRSLFPGAGGSRDSKQFAVTFFVNENDKTKLVDILHKAKNVISKKVEKVMGRKPPPKTSVSNAETLTSILETWVSQEEEEGRKEENEIEDLIEKQREQVSQMRSKGLSPPVNYIPVPSVVSPVPEEDEDDLSDADNEEDISDAEESAKKKASDMTVQVVEEGKQNFLRPPPPQRFQLSRNTTPALSPRRSLSPCENVPRHFPQKSDNDLYPPSLRRPSSHYDEVAQAACSRPMSPKFRPFSPEKLGLPGRGSELVSPPPTPVPEANEEEADEDGLDAVNSFQSALPHIQRPESMTVPIGGVWRPNDSDYEEAQLFSDEEKNEEGT